MHPIDVTTLFDHAAYQSMPLMATVGDGGSVRVLPRADERPRIVTRYHPDDGYHAARLDTGDFEPLYRAGSYLILVTGTLRDAVVNRPALFTRLDGSGWFGMVERVTADLIDIRPIRVGRPAAVIPRERLAMVYVPVDRLPASTATDERGDR